MEMFGICEHASQRRAWNITAITPRIKKDGMKTSFLLLSVACQRNLRQRQESPACANRHG
jgi:hypothetical protein